jgi:hypothetical protein
MIVSVFPLGNLRLSCLNHFDHTAQSLSPIKESLGQLVVLGFDVAVFTPAPYQRRRLQRPSMEF